MNSHRMLPPKKDRGKLFREKPLGPPGLQAREEKYIKTSRRGESRASVTGPREEEKQEEKELLGPVSSLRRTRTERPSAATVVGARSLRLQVEGLQAGGGTAHEAGHVELH